MKKGEQIVDHPSEGLSSNGIIKDLGRVFYLNIQRVQEGSEAMDCRCHVCSVESDCCPTKTIPWFWL